MISEWFDMMADVITYAQVTGRDAAGVPTHGTATSYRARVIRRAIRTTNRFSGQDDVAAGEVWVGGIIYPQQDDLITLPDGTQPKIINWDTIPDENGPHHTKVQFGATQGTQHS